jgi:prevent-host-death family protein
MRPMGLFKAKQKLSELVTRVQEGEHIGITRRGKLAAMMISAQPEVSVKEIVEKIEQVRRRSRRVKGVTAKGLIEKGRV